MEFERDNEKREANLVKHGIDFVRGITIWMAPVIDPADCRQEGGEARYLALGIIGEDDLIIGVVYTMRGSVRRIISARRARRYERTNYQDQYGRGC